MHPLKPAGRLLARLFRASHDLQLIFGIARLVAAQFQSLPLSSHGILSVSPFTRLPSDKDTSQIVLGVHSTLV